MQKAIPAVFMRGGTSRALIFHARDLPPSRPPHDCAAWDPILLAAIGSPDPSGRQLDGMGGGISSLSKIAVVGPASRADADVDYTFGQVAIREPVIGYRGNCGNISSAIGPFAIDEGLVSASGDTTTVRIHNTNTGKIIAATFPLKDGKAATEGDFVLQGVAGSGARIELAFLDPGGAATGKLLPTGHARDSLDLPGHGSVDVSLIDAANPTVFVAADALGLTGGELPAVLTDDQRLMSLFEDLRVTAALAMGLVGTADEARKRVKNLPLVSIVSAPANANTLKGVSIAADAMDIQTRMVSSGQPHLATPLTGAMCLAVAARIPGTIPHAIARTTGDSHDFRIVHPSGILPVVARVRVASDGISAERAVVYRTARRLMEGRVLVPEGRL